MEEESKATGESDEETGSNTEVDQAQEKGSLVKYMEMTNTDWTQIEE